MKKFILATLLTITAQPAIANPPIEAYGELPETRSVALSADASRFAYFARRNGQEIVNVGEMGGKSIFAANIKKVKARSLEFVTNDYVVFHGSRSTNFRARNKYEFNGAVAINLKKKDTAALIKGTEDLYAPQSGLGKIVGISEDDKKVFMPAFMGADTPDPKNSLLKVDLDTGRGRVFSKGLYDTIDWIVDRDGTIFAREDYREQGKKYSINTKVSGKWKTVYEQKTNLLPFSLLGVKQDGSALLIVDEVKGSDVDQLFELDFDGKITGPVFANTDREIARVLTDINRKVIGVEFDGQAPSYEFYDQALNKAVRELVAEFDGLAISIESWTDNYDSLLLHISGSGTSPAYYRFDVAKRQLSMLTKTYPQIDDDDVGEVLAIKYKASDGLEIPAIVTFPPNADKSKPLPLIVLPHGGPSSNDTMEFDWLSQYFANRGYLVFQPNFRGSTGYGGDFRRAGRGEWGGKMQQDLTDGLNVLLRAGWADKDRTCILGASYGGYAALAGGAFTPDLYKCVAAIAPVSDVVLMLDNVRSRRSSASQSYRYWQLLIGDRRKEKDKLQAISPVNHAAAFKAPVLLIHGNDDTVVDFEHSKRMERALSKAGKDVKLVKLRREDHWLSQSETRLQTLKELDAFVEKHIGSEN